MPYDLFWHGDPEAVRPYREADRLSMRRADQAAWLQGRYVYDAMLSAAPLYMTFHRTHRPQPYDELPYTERTEQEEARRKAERELDNGRRAALDIARWVEASRRANEEKDDAKGATDG